MNKQMTQQHLANVVQGQKKTRLTKEERRAHCSPSFREALELHELATCCTPVADEPKKR